MKTSNLTVSRAEFEENIFLKQNNSVFNRDIRPLLSVDQAKAYLADDAYSIVFQQFLTKLKGKPWKGLTVESPN